MKTMCPPGYHHNGFVATHVLGHMMYGSSYIMFTVHHVPKCTVHCTSCAQAHELPQSRCGDNREGTLYS